MCSTAQQIPTRTVKCTLLYCVYIIGFSNNIPEIYAQWELAITKSNFHKSTQGVLCFYFVQCLYSFFYSVLSKIRILLKECYVLVLCNANIVSFFYSVLSKIRILLKEYYVLVLCNAYIVFFYSVLSKIRILLKEYYVHILCNTNIGFYLVLSKIRILCSQKVFYSVLNEIRMKCPQKQFQVLCQYFVQCQHRFSFGEDCICL